MCSFKKMESPGRVYRRKPTSPFVVALCGVGLVKLEPHFAESLACRVSTCQERSLMCDLREWSNSHNVVLWRRKRVPSCVAAYTHCCPSAGSLAPWHSACRSFFSPPVPESWARHPCVSMVKVQLPLQVVLHMVWPHRVWWSVWVVVCPYSSTLSLLLSISSFPSWLPVWLIYRGFPLSVRCGGDSLHRLTHCFP